MNRRWIRGFTLKILYPLLVLAGFFAKGKKEVYQRLIINLNNKLVKKELPKVKTILLSIEDFIV